MIQLQKGPTPPHLEGLLNDWTAELLDAIEVGDDARKKTIEKRYSDRRIKTALLEETRNKCAYCESRFNVTSHPRVEHIKPRTIAPELTFSWPNLTIACEICNGKKSDYWSLDLPLLNPIAEDPARHLWAPTWILETWLDSPRGAFAIQKIDLNRGGLWERRRDRLRSVQGVIDRWRDAPTSGEKDGYWHALQKEMSDDKEFLLMIRSIVNGLVAGSTT